MALTAGPDGPADVGELLRRWRRRRHRTQLELSLATGVSTRHLSYIENGRSRPSAEALLVLTAELGVPLREQNRMLVAAGHAPRPVPPPAAASMEAVRATCRRLLDATEPYPAVVLDGCWDVVAGNRASRLFLQGVPEHLCRPVVNLFRLTLHPEGLAAHTVNFDQWARQMLAQLVRLADTSSDPRLDALLDEVSAYANVAEVLRAGVSDDDIDLVLPLRYRVPAGGGGPGGSADGAATELVFITTLTVFATPADESVGELAIEVCFPGDAATEAHLRSH